MTAEITKRAAGEISDQQFRWKTAEGRILTLAQMNTGHIFNAMKMCFNHLAAQWGATPVWFVQQYGYYQAHAARTPEVLACCVVTFIAEIEERGDLPDKYWYPYREIVEQLRPRLVESERRLLPENPISQRSIMPEQRHSEYVKVVFTDAEVADFARGLAQANRKRSSIEQQKKEVDTQLKAEIEAENTNIKRLSDHISNGHEYRNVECRVDLDAPEPGKKTIIRLDTGEVVKVQPMTDMDRQMRLELKTAEEAAAIAANPPAVEAAPGAPTPESIPEPPADGPALVSAREVGATHRRGARNRNPEAEAAIQRRGNRDPNAEAIADGTAPLEGEEPNDDDAPF